MMSKNKNKESHRLVCLDDYEDEAKRFLSTSAFDYYASGADEEVTLTENRQAFRNLRIIPRMFKDVSNVDLSTSILGIPLSFPVCIAPTAMNAMAHQDGEKAVARAASTAGIIYSLSTISTTSIEDVSIASPSSPKFFQLYVYRDREVTERLVRRAEAADFKGLLLTVDAPELGSRRKDNRNQFKLPSHLRMANFNEADFKSLGVNYSKNESGLNEYAAALFDPSLTWSILQWLTEITKLPIVVKGILSADDAREAMKYNISGIVVSNHGARQLDTVPATIDVLEEIIEAVNGGCEVYLDGGVRTGTDVLKAICLGARAVFIGRPAIYALACKGQDGVEEMLAILKNEFRKAMELTGCQKIKDLQKKLIRRKIIIS